LHPSAAGAGFPQLGTLFLSTVTQRCLAIMAAQLQAAKEQQIITDVDFDAVTPTMFGGLLSHIVIHLISTEEAPFPSFDRADAVVAVIVHALTPSQPSFRGGSSW
jgi:hypothetical protein